MAPKCQDLGLYLLWSADTSRGWRVVNRVSYADAARKVEQGKWREVYDDVSCVLVGFQVISPAMCRGDKDIRASDNHSAAICAKEMQAVVGCLGKSRTARMSEDERAGERKPEDFIERSERKFFVFSNHVGPAAGDILRAWPRPQ